MKNEQLSKTMNSNHEVVPSTFNRKDTVGKSSHNKAGASIHYDGSSIISKTSVEDETTLLKFRNNDGKQVSKP